MTSRLSLAQVLKDAEVFVDGDWVESKDQDPDGDVRLIQLADIGDGYFIDKSSKYLTKDKAKLLRCTFLKEGDILIARMPDPLGRACIFPKMKQECVTVVDVCIIRPNPKTTDSRWLMHCINSEIMRNQINSYISGATRQRISRGNLSRIKIDFPPLEEQRRIASILDKADAIRQKRQQAIAKLDELLQATFIDMFGDPLDNPKKYQMMTLGSISSFENGDRSNNYPSGADVVQEGIPFLSTKNIKGNFFDSSNMQFITQEKFNKLSRGKVSNGDILITLRGTLGSTCIYECEYPQAFINAQMMIIRANKNFMSNRFLHIILSSEAMQKHLKSIGNGAAVQQLTATQLKNISIITPDRNNQEIFIKFYESLQNQKSLLKRALNNADDFFKSLQHRAFNGTL